ncbi:MAG TPA: hypothetical protein VF765_02760 [Polyangiaceae bacterium]
MAQPATRDTVIHEGVDAENRAAALGLTVALLLDVVRQGEYARAEATENDPLNAAGTDAYRYRVRAFRDALCVGPTGWTKEHDRGLEKTKSPCGRHAVITRGGDLGVGLRDAHPQPAGRIGEMTLGAVDANSSLLLDPNWMNAAPTNDADDDSCETWMFLVFRDGDLVRSEISLPSKVEEKPTGTLVLGWKERVILPQLDFSSEPGAGSKPSRNAPEPVVEEPTVVRKR